VNATRPAVPADRYNAAIEHPTVALALRHLARKRRGFPASQLVSRLSALEQFPGVSIANLIAASTSAGLPLKGVSATVEELAGLPLPVLAYLRRGPEAGAPFDLIQIERIGPVHVLISSDRFGQRRMPRAVMEQHWTGIVLVADPDADVATDRASELESYKQQVSVIPGMITPAECVELIGLCEEACFRRSKVAHRKGATREDRVSTAVRSSTSVVLFDRKHPILSRLYAECAAREGVSTSHIEEIQCVRYKKGQRFRAHFDGGLNLPRLTTYLLYLNDDFQGGETYFPLLDRAVAPKAGAALRFPSCDREGRVLWPSEHGGLPISDGVKYALNIWVRCPGSPVARP
jgi:hypothetical protein